MRNEKVICEQRRSHTAGFTLVEIVVVIAIVGVLAALLFTVFARVREGGRRTVCQSTLKQLALAVQQYTTDNDGRFPNDYWHRQLFPYLKATAMIQCPTNAASYFNYNPIPTESELFKPPDFYVLGYWYNGLQLSPLQRVADGTLRFVSKHEAGVPAPSMTWMHKDVEPGVSAGAGGTAAYSPSCDEHFRYFGATLHSGGANYSFVDGHVKWLTPSKAKQTACSSGSAQ